jgi:hypothetical protein
VQSLARLSLYVLQRGTMDQSWFHSGETELVGELFAKDAALFRVLADYFDSELRFSLPMTCDMFWSRETNAVLHGVGVDVYSIASSVDARKFLKRLSEIGQSVDPVDPVEIAKLYALNGEDDASSAVTAYEFVVNLFTAASSIESDRIAIFGYNLTNR